VNSKIVYKADLPIIEYALIDKILTSYNPALRDHDAITFAIEVANCQRDIDWSYIEKLNEL